MLAGGSIYAASRATDDSLLRMVGEEGGVDPRGSSPISPHSMTEGLSRSRGGSAFFKYFSGEGPRGAASLRRGVPEVGHSPVEARMAINGNGMELTFMIRENTYNKEDR